MADPAPPPVFTVISREVARRRPASIDEAGREVPAAGFATSFAKIDMTESKVVVIPVFDPMPAPPPRFVYRAMRSRVTYLVLLLVALVVMWALVRS